MRHKQHSGCENLSPSESMQPAECNQFSRQWFVSSVRRITTKHKKENRKGHDSGTTIFKWKH